MKTATDSDQNIKNILFLARETSQVGSESLKELERQNHVLRKANDKVHEMHDELGYAERSLDNIESFWKRVANWFSPQPEIPFHPNGFTTKTSSYQPTFSLKEEEEDLNAILDQVEHSKKIALAISEAIDKSNEVMGELNENTEWAQHRVKIITKRTKLHLG